MQKIDIQKRLLELDEYFMKQDQYIDNQLAQYKKLNNNLSKILKLRRLLDSLIIDDFLKDKKINNEIQKNKIKKEKENWLLKEGIVLIKIEDAKKKKENQDKALKNFEIINKDNEKRELIRFIMCFKNPKSYLYVNAIQQLAKNNSAVERIVTIIDTATGNRYDKIKNYHACFLELEKFNLGAYDPGPDALNERISTLNFLLKNQKTSFYTISKENEQYAKFFSQMKISSNKILNKYEEEYNEDDILDEMENTLGEIKSQSEIYYSSTDSSQNSDNEDDDDDVSTKMIRSKARMDINANTQMEEFDADEDDIENDVDGNDKDNEDHDCRDGDFRASNTHNSDDVSEDENDEFEDDNDDDPDNC
jgi:hypothetical protein